MDKTIKLDLSALGDGGLQEKVDKEFEKVFDNILDPNTDDKVVRKLVITLTIKADDSREVISISMDVKSTLAPQTGVATTVLVGKKDGKTYANVLKSNMPGHLKVICLVKCILTIRHSFVQILDYQ